MSQSCSIVPAGRVQEIEKVLIPRRDAAQLLSISERTLYALTKRGEIPSRRIGRKVLYGLDQLRAWATMANGVMPSTAVAV
jgi:excisionase family DNA binding protein